MNVRDAMMGTTVLGRYRVVARLGQGGMGVVYLARAEGAAGFAKPVVVKRILADHSGNADITRLFVREAKILSNLQHPNIVSVIDFGEADGAYIMVLDYIRAYDVDRWFEFLRAKGERLPMDGLVYIMVKVLEALGHAHTLAEADGTPREIVHSDVSPGNILVDTEGQVKLLDFGIARMKGDGTRTTNSKTIRGKLGYLPVEALDGSPPNVTTDIYACAVTLYELLTGDHPFLASDETRTIAKVLTFNPPPPSEMRPEVSPELDAIVLRGMAKDKAQRFASAKEFARELRRTLRVPEDEAASALAELAKRDFPAMSAGPGLSLAELDAAWRNPPSSPASHVIAAPSSAELGHAETVAVRVKPSSGLLIGGIAVGALLIGGVVTAAAVWLARRPDAEAPKVLLVEREVATASAAPESSTATPPTQSAEVAAGGSGSGRAPTPPPTPVRSAKPAAPSDPLSGALATNQAQIEACFRDKGAGVTSEVAIRITIDRDGAVQRAEALPAELTSSPLGQCLTTVARKTKFPAQTNPTTTFRIPLRARRVP